jgi:cytosine/adenosine deaminase-related metal-dependent hydrolase
MQDLNINNVILPARGSGATWNIVVKDNKIHNIDVAQPERSNTDANVTVLLPALCHPHIHLDKPYILTCNHGPSDQHPDYTDLAPASGTFAEALANTAEAKKRYTEDDLYLRGAQLLATSYRQGVTALRAFVEIDHVTDTKALRTAVRLKKDFSHLVEMQICAFAQDPIFSTDFGDQNRVCIESALVEYAHDIDVLGSTPYVEKSRDAAVRNIEWAIQTALANNLHLDFHLDYNLDSASTLRPLTYTVVDKLQQNQWAGRADASKTIVLGHCTQLSGLTVLELRDLARRIRESKLPIFFVGLPTSDLFMMGRPADSTDGSAKPHTRSRGTLQVPSLIRDYGLSACLGVNNVGNAFTPYGTGDPLQLASLGVGIYQSGTPEDAKILYSCVSWGARRAIGFEIGTTTEAGDVAEGDDWRPMLLVKNEQDMKLPDQAGGCGLIVKARPRLDFKDVVWDPPDLQFRSIVG